MFRILRSHHRPGPVAAIYLLLATLGVAFPAAAQSDYRGLAFVRADGSLKIGTRIFRLYGIYIPPSGRTCETRLRPVRCGSRAVLELERAVNGFATCTKVARNPDRTVAAICTVRPDGAALGEREDLAARLLRKGWAVARPEAPFEYRTFEKIARVRGRGIWGLHADSLQFR